MPSNTTGVLDLPLYDMVNDNGVKFLLFRDALCGTGSNSAMYKINDWATNKVGRNTDLATTEKGTIVGAINEVRSGIGSLANHVTTEVGILGNLTTTNKDNVVAAINEVKSNISSIDVSWSGISGKPSVFPPADHNHNTLYSPTNHNHDGVYSPSVHTHTIAQVTGLQVEIDGLKSSVSSGKTQVANAITGKGVSASGSDTFDTLATKIGQIKTADRTLLVNDNIAMQNPTEKFYYLDTNLPVLGMFSDYYYEIIVTNNTGSSSSYVSIYEKPYSSTHINSSKISNGARLTHCNTGAVAQVACSSSTASGHFNVKIYKTKIDI